MSKQLLPVYNKPMVYYPLSMLMFGGIREILIISTPEDLPTFRRLLKDGSQWGIRFAFAEQTEPRGLADAFNIGRDFLEGEESCLILGDNIFYGSGLVSNMEQGTQLKDGARVFAYQVTDPERYGVVEFDSEGKAISLEEKPNQPKSHFAVPGIYFYDRKVTDYVARLKPSSRGEIEITDLNRIYLEKGQLTVDKLGRGIAWLDAGTHQSLLQASNFVQTVEERLGLMISCPEEIAYRMGFIDKDRFFRLVNEYHDSTYGQYLKQIEL